MSETSGFSEGIRPVPGLEEVPAPEYESSLTTLHEYLAKDKSSVTNLTMLEDTIAGVGKALNNVIRRNGKLLSGESPDGGVSTRRVLKEQLPRGERKGQELMGLLESDGVTLKVVAPGDENLALYAIDVPFGKFSGVNLDAESCEYTYANEPGEKPQEHINQPGMEPDNEEAQTAYLRVLDNAVADALSVSSEPTSMEGIEDPFKE